MEKGLMRRIQQIPLLNKVFCGLISVSLLSTMSCSDDKTFLEEININNCEIGEGSFTARCTDQSVEVVGDDRNLSTSFSLTAQGINCDSGVDGTISFWFSRVNDSSNVIGQNGNQATQAFTNLKEGDELVYYPGISVPQGWSSVQLNFAIETDNGERQELPSCTISVSG